MEIQTFRDACLRIVLDASDVGRLQGVEACAKLASTTTEEECAESLDKRAKPKETWPGVGALMHAMEDEFPSVRISAIKALGVVAMCHTRLKNQCVKTILDGLQDLAKDVRLMASKVVMDCKPKQFEAAELRLLLETLTSDDSIEVQETILRMFLAGPSFADANHAAVTAEWLSSLPVCSDIYLFQFGVTHAALLYHCCGALEKCKPTYRVGVLIILAGLASVWGYPRNLSAETITQCNEMLQTFQSREQVVRGAERGLNKAVQDGSIVHVQNLHKGVALFAEDVLRLSSADEDDKREMLLYWSGFDKSSNDALSRWSNEMGIGFPVLRFDSDYHDHWDDSLPPRKTSFEIGYSVESKGISRLPFGIARIRVCVRAKHLHSEVSSVLLMKSPDGSIEKYPLLVMECTARLVVFTPVLVAYPFRGALSDLIPPTFSVKLFSAAS